MTCKGCIAALEHTTHALCVVYVYVRTFHLNDNNKRVLRRYTFCFSFQQLLSKSNARLFSLFVICAAVCVYLFRVQIQILLSLTFLQHHHIQ